jgi:hypothetical protein
VRPTRDYVLFEAYNGGTWTGPDDQTSAVQVAYDLDNVYFGFVVTDEYHENAANSAWNGDSVQLMIADEFRTNQVALYNYALGGVETNLGTTIIMHEAGPGGTKQSWAATPRRRGPPMKSNSRRPGADGPYRGTVRTGHVDQRRRSTDAGQRGWGGLRASIVFGKTPETALMTGLRE